ncbi:MAG: ATP-dependent Clp protease ATP-binding subunit, partial [Actinobacteria bacterium]
INQFGRDLTADVRSGRVRGIYGRDAEIQTVVEVLCRTEKRNPLLIGAAGSGKTAIVEGFACKVASGDVPELLKGVRVLAIETSSLVSGTSLVGSFEERMRKIIAEASQPDVILFIDEAHTVMGAGGSQGGMADMLKPTLARGEIAVIAATTDDEYRRHIQQDKALSRRFQPIPVKEMGPEQALEVLKLRRDALKDKRGVEVSDDILSGLVNFADEYLRSRTFPDKALDLLEQVVAHAVAGGETAVTTENASEVTSRLAGHPLPPAEALTRLRKEFAALGVADTASAEKVIGRLNTTLNALDVDACRPNLVAALVGDAAMHTVEIARALSRALFDSPDRILDLDLNQMRDEESVNSLIGPPPGYIGFGGALPIHELAVTPCTVVVVEGADVCHAVVGEVLANGLAQGFIEDSAGGRYYLSDAVVLVPVSADTPEARKVPLGSVFGRGDAPERVATDAAALAEAVLGRALCRQMDMVLSDLVAVTDASKDVYLRDSVLPKVTQRFEKRGLKITWDDGVVDLLLKETSKLSDLIEVEHYTEDLVSGLVLAKVALPPLGEVRLVRLGVSDGAVVAEERE